MKLFVDFWKFSKTGKKSEINKHSSFDGLIQEDIDMSDIYLAVGSNWMPLNAWKHTERNRHRDNIL